MTQTAERPAGAAPARDRILDAAEELFAEHGFAATGLRQITARAGVNLAAVNYHFHTKDDLFIAVFLRKVEPINRRRLELLDRAEAAASPPVLEEVIAAFLDPVLEAGRNGRALTSFARLMGRMVAEPGGWAERVFPAALHAVAERFLRAFRRSLGGIDTAELMWGMHFGVGVMSFYTVSGGLLAAFSNGRIDPADVAGARRRMIRYLAGGLRALAARRRSAAQ